jgi:energy-coupling factor transporter ATP-binding protein EcfA2
MTAERFYELSRRKTIVMGHSGSGKTEFSVSLAMLLAAQENPRNLAIVDIDIINPYFRSRERRGLLEAMGVDVYGSVYNEEITAEIPALGANIKKPLEDESCHVIIDTGGNDSGAIVLNQFTKYFTDDTMVLAVVNANRPDTSTIKGAIAHMNALENITDLKIDAIVNNSHLLTETTADVIIKGHEFCTKLCEETGKTLFCDCFPNRIVCPGGLSGLSDCLMPMGLFMGAT